MTVFAIGLAYLSNPVSPYISSLFIRPPMRTKVFVVAISYRFRLDGNDKVKVNNSTFSHSPLPIIPL